MRTLPPPLLSCALPPPNATETAPAGESDALRGVPGAVTPLDGRGFGGRAPYDLDQRLATTDVDIRRLPNAYEGGDGVNNDENEIGSLRIVEDAQAGSKVEPEGGSLPLDMPKAQRELFMRIQARQRENLLESQGAESDDGGNNVNWYSDDDEDEDDDRLTIKVDGEDVRENKEEDKDLREKG